MVQKLYGSKSDRGGKGGKVEHHWYLFIQICGNYSAAVDGKRLKHYDELPFPFTTSTELPRIRKAVSLLKFDTKHFFRGSTNK